MASNGSIGSAPLNLLPNTKKFVTFFHAEIEAGRLPVRELPMTLKASLCLRFHTQSRPLSAAGLQLLQWQLWPRLSPVISKRARWLMVQKAAAGEQ